MTDPKDNPSQKAESEKSQPFQSVGEVGAYTAGGAIAGAVTSATLGGMGLAVAGTAVGIGMLPVTIAGAVVGLAAFGLKKAFFDNEPKTGVISKAHHDNNRENT
jgi:hypothetical protein